MFPIKDDNPTESFPYVTIILIIVSVSIFFLQLMYDSDGVPFTTQLAVIPVRFTSDFSKVTEMAGVFTVNPYATLFTYAFLHGGLFHLAFNMLFLWIFGNNIEDALGKVKFIVFYLVCGVAAALLHIAMSHSSPIQMVGASGAIAGILGAYMVLYPHAHIHTLFIFFFIIRIIKVPAIFFIGFWFFIQVMNVTGGAAKGIAWYAHIGGFIAGLILILLLNPKKKKKAKIVYH